MNKIALRFGYTRQWNHLYFQNLSSLHPSLTHGILQLPKIKRDLYIKNWLHGLIPVGQSKFGSNTTSNYFEIHQTRDLLDIYISQAKYINRKNPLVGLQAHRLLLNILKLRLNFFNLYTFPLHDAELFIKFLLKDHKNKARLHKLKLLLQLGFIKGIKIKIKGRFKKSSRTKKEIFQFGQIPNTPTTNLTVELFYSSQVLLQPLGTSSLQLYIVY